MECPHCYGEMYYVANGNWWCEDCLAKVIDVAIPGLHYFSDGRVHKVVSGRCRISIAI
jgi:hypothetical protein